MNDNLIIYGSGDVTSLKLYAESLGIGERVHLPGQISDVPTFIKVRGYLFCLRMLRECLMH